MKDVLGQEIVVGAKVLWSGGQTQYAGFAGGPRPVTKITAKQVKIEVPTYWGSKNTKIVCVDPHCVVVVDKLLQAA